jgi:hypothetical protein
VIVVWAVSTVLFVYAVLDVARSAPAAVRTLPKPVWFLVLLAPLLGPAAWLLVGRPARTRRPGKQARGAPDDDDDFLRDLRRETEDRRRRSRDPRDDEL